jgi:hypothetical protein
MAITLRQTYRLLRRYRDGGPSAVANQRRGRPSNNRLPDVVRDHAIALVRERYADFGPTFAAEIFALLHRSASLCGLIKQCERRSLRTKGGQT